jgi:hypothetical protein
MNFKSQAGQDRFVVSLLDGQRNGFFLDIGANNPIEINNTFVLETELGWHGLSVDNSLASMEAFEKKRKTAFMLSDASQPQDWLGALAVAQGVAGLPETAPSVVDYLSLDVDEATLSCMRNLPWGSVRFRVMTIEHDRYRFGLERAMEMQDILHRQGYFVLCTDVCDKGLPFEMWAVDRGLVDFKRAMKFFRDIPTNWQEIVG